MIGVFFEEDHHVKWIRRIRYFLFLGTNSSQRSFKLPIVVIEHPSFQVASQSLQYSHF